MGVKYSHSELVDICPALHIYTSLDVEQSTAVLDQQFYRYCSRNTKFIFPCVFIMINTWHFSKKRGNMAFFTL